MFSLVYIAICLKTLSWKFIFMLKKAIRPKYSLQKDMLFFDNLYTYTLMDEENWFNFDKIFPYC